MTCPPFNFFINYDMYWWNIPSRNMHSLEYTLWKNQKLVWATRWFPMRYPKQLLLSNSIITQCIVVVHFQPIFIFISNNFRILELNYLPIHCPSLLLLDLRHSQTGKGWHHHNIIIRILLKYTLNSVLSHSPLRNTTQQIFLT